MSKTWIESLRARLLLNAVRPLKQADRAVHAALARQRLSHWHPASTAPCNQELELRVTEDGLTTTLPFPCRRTNRDEWINVDLGVPLRIQAAQWRTWQKAQSPHPYQSSILRSEGAAVRRQELWGGRHEGANSGQGSLRAKPEA
jgi:hypothetical protein